MNKKILGIFIALVTICVLFSCANETALSDKEYTVLEAGGSDYVTDAQHKMEIDLSWEYETLDAQMNHTQTVKVNDFDRQLKYVKTEDKRFFHHEVDYYEYSSNEEGLTVRIGVNTDTGIMDRYVVSDKYHAQKNAESVCLKKDECLHVAEKYLASFIDDIQMYTLVEESYRDLPEWGGMYLFRFTRVIDGVETSDKAFVGVTVYGSVFYHQFYNIGEMKDAVAPSEEEMEKIHEAINKKVTSIYENVTDQYTIEHETKDMILTRLEDGQYALDVHVSVDLRPLDDTMVGHTELMRLIVCLE